MSATNYQTTALIHACTQLVLGIIAILLWTCGCVENDLKFQKQQQISEATLADRSIQVLPWGGFKFNYALTDSVAYPAGERREGAEPKFFSLHIPALHSRKRKQHHGERRSKSVNLQR